MKNLYRAAPIILAEAPAGQYPSEVQVLKTGVFTDPRYGKFEITLKMLSEMVDNFKKGVRGVKPAIDFKHDSEAEAAAWMKDVYTKPGAKPGVTELWVKPDWTAMGCKSLSDRTYGYLSADFSQNYQDNEEGKFHGAVLLGAALTNRPVIKNMQPVIQLSEGDRMFKKLSETKKLADISPEDLEKVSALVEQLGASSIEELMAKIAEMQSQVKQAGEMVPEEKKEMEKQLSELKTENAKLKGDVTLSEQNKEFDKMLTAGKACEAQRESFIKGDVKKFAELAVVGGVKTKEVGSEAGKEGDDAVSDDDKVLKLAEEKLKNKEAKDIGSAISMVLKEQKNK